MNRRDVEIRRIDGVTLAIVQGTPEPINLDEVASDGNYRMEAILKKLGISDRHLRRVFQTVGITPHKWMEQHQMEAARNLLRKRVSIKETAFTLGFSSPKTFSKKFHRFHQMVPTEFQQHETNIGLKALGTPTPPIAPATRKKITNSQACRHAPVTGCPFHTKKPVKLVAISRIPHPKTTVGWHRHTHQ